MNLRDIECFIAVTEELHFSNAAKQLHLSAPAVTEAIRRLERDIGGQLLARTTRRVEVTSLGAEFLERARPAYLALREAYEDARRVAVRSPSRFRLSYTKECETRIFAVVAELAKRVPNVTVEISELGTADQLDALLHHRIDAGVAWEPPVSAPFAVQVLERSGYTAFVLEGHGLAAERELSLRQLARERLVLTPQELNPRLFMRVVNAFTHAGIEPNLMPAAFGNLTTQVLAGRGIGLMPTLSVPEPGLPGIRYIRLAADGPVVERALVWHQDHTWPYLASLIECLTRWVCGPASRSLART